MNRTLALGRRVIQQLAADRRTLVLLLVVPLVALTVVGILARSGTGQVAVGIVNLDEGGQMPFGTGAVNLGALMTDALANLTDSDGVDATASISVQVVDAEQATEMIRVGSLDAAITLPADFTTHTIETRTLDVPVEFEGSNPTVSRLLEALITRSGIQALAGISPLAAQNIPQVNLAASYRYGGPDLDALDYLAPVVIGLFVFLFVFILTSVAFLRERAAGTLERLQASPIRRHEIILGYMAGFSLFALAQSAIILGFTIFGLRIHYAGSLLVVFAVEVLLALMAVNLGIFFSTFARNEFQIVQFIPLVLVTQIALSGALWPIEAMPDWLKPIAWLMPLSHANQALRDVMIRGYDLIGVLAHVLALAAFAAVFVVLAAQTVRKPGYR